MSLEASLRFQAGAEPKAPHLRKAYENQIERIKVRVKIHHPQFAFQF